MEFAPLPVRRFGLPLVALGLTLLAGGCQTASMGDITGSVASRQPPPPTSDEPHLRAYAEEMAPRYAAHPDDKATAMNYATALRRLTQHAQAVAVLQRLAVKNPHDMEVLAAYGKALADAGRLQEAQNVLERSHTPERPNWTVLSAQGSVSDQMGNHAQAQAYYQAALKIVPNQPKVLSNLGLSYALEHKMPAAEEALRQAVAQPAADMRERQNLALVLSLEGKYAEAEDISRRDLTPIDAADNVAQIKQMIAQSDVWKTSKAPASRVAARQSPVRTQTASTDVPE
jgi:Flp pilus assembly protein TadD